MALTDLTQYIWVAWDLLAVYIIFRCARMCAHRGLAASIAGILVYVVAVAAAAYIYKQMAVYIYDNIVRDAVRHILARNFNVTALDAGGEIGNIIKAIPFVLRLLMPDNGLAAADLAAGQAVTAGETDGVMEVLAGQITDVILKEPLITALTAVSFLLIFSLVAFLMRSLTRMVTGINFIPVVGGVNIVLGCIFGLFEAALTLYVGAFVIRLLILFSGSSLWWFNDSVMKATYIWSIFY